MEALKLFLKRGSKNLILSWPIFVGMLIIGLANPLLQYLGVPIWVTNSAGILTMIGWCVFYWLKGAEDRRKIAEDKKAFADKVVAAEIQLFGENHSSN